MRKPNALTKSLAPHCCRAPVQLCTPQLSRYLNPPLPSSSAALHHPAETSILLTSSSCAASPAAAHADGESSELASYLYDLIQLRLHSSVLHGGMGGSLAGPQKLPQHDVQDDSAQQRLCREVAALGNALMTFSSDHVLCRNRLAGEVAHGHGRHRGGAQSSVKEKRPPVQLLAVPSDAERSYALPLQRELVEHVMSQLTHADRLFRSLSRWQLEALVAESASTPPRLSSSSDKTIGRGVSCPHHADVASVFYRECGRVAAILSVLCEAYESNGEALACLAHVLEASADAQVEVTASTLISMVEATRSLGAKVSTHAAGTGDGKGEGEGSSKRRKSSLTPDAEAWHSCVPWLLHRFSRTCCTTRRKVSNEGEWSLASAWMKMAADRLCATQTSELLSLPSSRHTVGRLGERQSSGDIRAAAEASSGRAAPGLFGGWQRVLDEEADAVVASAPTRAIQGMYKEPRWGSEQDRPVRGRHQGTLAVWLGGAGSCVKREAEGAAAAAAAAAGSTIRPYFAAAVREILASGAEAVDALMALSEQHKQTVARVPARRAKAQQTPQRQPHSAPPPPPELAQALQFHAIGAYVALRRITSSLQHHRRLAPLLQLHAMVSGCGGHTSAHREGGRERKSQDVAAATRQHRRRLLRGELLDSLAGVMPARHGKGSSRSSALRQQREQAGAMLWREVALLDAFTLITLGHVSEHAVDAAELNKSEVLRQLAWLQAACIDHLRTLDGSAGDSSDAAANQLAAEATKDPFEQEKREEDDAARLSAAAIDVLRRRLTPRTRQALVDRLREGLRLSAKVLTRWQEPQLVCALYRSYPAMGASWEVGRALLHCGHFETAVAVLQSLLAASPAAGERLQAGGQPRQQPASTLRSSNAVVVRQLLVEAMRGAAASLVCQEYSTLKRQGGAEAEGRTAPAAASQPPSIPSDRLEGAAVGDGGLEGCASGVESEATGSAELEAPLPAELRARLHALYHHTTSLPVPLPLCLHAILQGLTDASAQRHGTAGLRSGTRLSAPSAATPLPVIGAASGFSAAVVEGSTALSREERMRQTAVLCTYVLRCHLAEHPSAGLLSSSVELWAATVVPYLCRHTPVVGGGAVTAAPPALTVTDRYLREVALRLLHGYPHLPVARLLLTRVVALCATAAATPPSLVVAPSHAAPPLRRAEVSLIWLLQHLFRFTGLWASANKRGSQGEEKEGQSERWAVAYPVCAPSMTWEAHARCGWNAGFTERYTQDSMRLMPRIALDGLLRVLDSEAFQRGALGTVVRAVRDRVLVALQCRSWCDDAQQQPWQCLTCFLWNGRYASACKRCHTLASALLQCRACGYFTSTAGYRHGDGLDCEVCGAVLVTSAAAAEGAVPGEAVHTPQHTPAAADESASTAAAPQVVSPRTPLAPPLANTSPLTPMEKFTAAATVTGSGRPASLFVDAPAVLRVLPLRRWTCAQCRTDNEPQHVFFCRSCGRAPTADTGRTAAAAVAAVTANTGAVPQCGSCGHEPQSLEGRLLPWCERCGALQSRLEQLLRGGRSPPDPSRAESTEGPPSPAPPATASGGRRPTLWWCAECTAALNPWTRTHCSVCSAGRPAAASEWLQSSTAQSTTRGLDSVRGLGGERARWLGNAAVPFIQLPWSMQSCPTCQAVNRTGSGHCWRCGEVLTWPAEVARTIAAEWKRWLTQVTQAVTLEESEVPNTSAAAKKTGAETSTACCDGSGAVDRDSQCPDSAQGAAALTQTTVLLLPRVQRWVCLRDGCLYVNGLQTTPLKAEDPSADLHAPVCCAACHAPRRNAEIFDPFHHQLGWRPIPANPPDTTDPGEATVRSSTVVVGALLLPDDAPHPLQARTVAPDTRTDNSSLAAVPHVAGQRVRIVPCAVDGAAVCACCGESMHAPSSNGRVSPLQSLGVEPLHLVDVCRSCGHCAWGRSCGAYESHPTAPTQGGLQAGEEALALRLLLRSVTRTVQRAVWLQRGGPSARPRQTLTRATSSEATPVTPDSLPPLDWAVLSRHVYAAVRLIKGRRVAAAGAAMRAASTTGGGGSDGRAWEASGNCDGHHQCTPRQGDEEEGDEARDALLPWRGCDVATADLLCSAEPRVAVLSDADGTVHSAILDVRQVLEGICDLVELRTAASSPASRLDAPRSAPRRRRSTLHKRPTAAAAAAATSAALPPAPARCLQDAWTRRLVCAALDLVDAVNQSTVFDEIGFATLRRVCLLLRPHEASHIDTETKWSYLQEMKLSRSAMVHQCVRCERCLTNHNPDEACGAV